MAANLPHPDGFSQVVILDVLMPEFQRWLTERRCHLFRMPTSPEDEIPTYGIGVSMPVERPA